VRISKALWLMLVTSLFIHPVICGNPDLTHIETEFKTKLEDALKELEQQRHALSQQQIPLAKETSSIKSELNAVQKELDSLKELHANQFKELDTLKTYLQESEKELNYIENTLIDEAVYHLESSLSIGELNSESHHLLKLISQRETKDSHHFSNTLNQLNLFEESYHYTTRLFDVQKYTGKALTQEGKQLQGNYLQLGPILYFISDNKKKAGLVIESHSLQPEIYELDKTSKTKLIDFHDQKSQLFPIDPSLNRAVMIASTEESLKEHLKKGGLWIYPIVFFALISSLIACCKSFQLFSLRMPKRHAITNLAQLMKAKDLEQAMALAQTQPEPAKKLLTHAVEYGNEHVELIEEAMIESLLQTQPKLESFLNILAVTAATAPLLGLLGTVTGIIKTFKLMEIFGAGDPQPLIAGISEALITTELGLILGIPALILHALLSRRVSRILSSLEEHSHHLINMISKTQESTVIKS
jgi:biopolymer transport protein ExbB